MASIINPSLTARTLRPTPTVSAPVAQRPVFKSPTLRTAQASDHFEPASTRGSGTQASGLVRKENPLGEIANTRLSAQQRLDFLQKFGAPKREYYPNTIGGSIQYNEAKAHYDRQVRQLTAEVKYDELKEQGAPQRKDFPAGLAGEVQHQKATQDYYKQLQQLAIEAGLILT